MGVLKRRWMDRTAERVGLRREPGDDPPARRPGFDWTDVAVGHWFVTGPAGSGKGGRAIWSAVSWCGVRATFRADALAAGATRTCEACRAGCAAPPAARVVTGGALAETRVLWEVILMEVRSNIVGPDAKRDFDEAAAPHLDRLVDLTGLGANFGWRARVRDCHKKAGGDRATPVKARGWHDGARRVELNVAGRGYWFEVDLTTGRTDLPWPRVRAAVEGALAALAAPAAPTAVPALPPPPAAAPAPPAADVAPPPPGVLGMNLDRLLRLREGIDTFVTLGRDVQATAELRAGLEKELAGREAAARPLAEAAGRTAAEAADLGGRLAAAQDEATRLQAALAAAVAARDRLAGEAEAARKRAEFAAAEYAPSRDALADMRKQLGELERVEEERAKTLAKAGDVAVLLAALEKLGAA